VLVTGGSSGIGFEIVRALAEEGAYVAAAARGGQRLRDAAASLKGKGLDVLALVMDVLSDESIEEAMKVIESHWGGLDVLINCAGIWMQEFNPHFTERAMPFYAYTREQMMSSMEINYLGYFATSQASMRFFLRQGEGGIVNIGMDEELFLTRGFAPIIPTRAATNALTMLMAAELKGKGVDVNLLTPGGFVAGNSMPSNADRAHFGKLLPTDICNEPMIFLCSDRARGISGEKIVASRFDEWLRQKGLEWRREKKEG